MLCGSIGIACLTP
ncbi:hypothetical protein LXG94_13465 [Vibrio harveyi]|nr:hypothetical protein LXG94_13465 [Vibrio harveyi]